MNKRNRMSESTEKVDKKRFRNKLESMGLGPNKYFVGKQAKRYLEVLCQNQKGK
jgi:hypothetical protein